MKIQVLLFVVITGCCALENLHGASFVFSTSSATARVVLKPNIIEPLREITACVQSYTDNILTDSFLRMDGEKSMTQFHLYQHGEYYNIVVGGVLLSIKTSKESMEWRLICASWESSTGVIHLVVNGKLFPRKVLRPGYIIDSNVTVVLGQNLNFYKGAPSYVGEIKNVNVWDRALHPGEMQSMYYDNCYYCNGNVISWESVDYEIYGDIILYKPSLKP